jgi:cell filamentation protein
MTAFQQIPNPYFYPGTNTYINNFQIQDPFALQMVERRLTAYRLAELRENPIHGNFDFGHLKSIHKYIFEDIYPWAGDVRDLNIGKAGYVFDLANEIDPKQKYIFYNLKLDNYFKDLTPEQFTEKAARLFGDINKLHPFPEGNGRVQREFMRELALNAGYKLDLSNTPKELMILASRESMGGNTKDFERIVKSRLQPLPTLEKIKDFNMQR